MTTIDDLEYTEKANSKFYKVIAQGRTYRAFEDSLAFTQFKEGKFKKGDNVELIYTEVPSKTDPKIVYKNLNHIAPMSGTGTIPSPGPQSTSAPPPQTTAKTTEVDPDVWVNKDRRIAREACVKAASRLISATIVADAEPDIKQFTKAVIKAAKEFEKYVYEGMESIPGKEIDVIKDNEEAK